MAAASARTRKIAKAVVVVLGWLPIANLAVRLLLDEAGADPIETMTHTTGEWALRFLVLCLAVTPLRRAFGASALAPYRRTFGLFAFAYATLHFSVWVLLDLGGELAFVGEEIAERPFITVGFAALVCLVPLAVTSTRGWTRRLGRRWLQLHRLVYAVGVLAVVHFWWGVKSDVREPAVYAALVAVLLGWRIWIQVSRSRANAG